MFLLTYFYHLVFGDSEFTLDLMFSWIPGSVTSRDPTSYQETVPVSVVRAPEGEVPRSYLAQCARL